MSSKRSTRSHDQDDDNSHIFLLPVRRSALGETTIVRRMQGKWRRRAYENSRNPIDIESQWQCQRTSSNYHFVNSAPLGGQLAKVCTPDIGDSPVVSVFVESPIKV